MLEAVSNWWRSPVKPDTKYELSDGMQEANASIQKIVIAIANHKTTVEKNRELADACVELLGQRDKAEEALASMTESRDKILEDFKRIDKLNCELEARLARIDQPLEAEAGIEKLVSAVANRKQNEKVIREVQDANQQLRVDLDTSNAAREALDDERHEAVNKFKKCEAARLQLEKELAERDEYIDLLKD